MKVWRRETDGRGQGARTRRSGPPFLRVVVDAGASGAWNMAVDEALLDDPGDGWTLRFYRWDRPTISLGYAQPYERGVDTVVARRLGIPVVRRPTGGRAVLHADELTYALTAPVDHGPLSAG
ncbi:MAG: lipoate--protein ligase family protein, partial [Acidobacteria bacterium]|nr:lipoate--protein ligase family protein [Acidobacteriota bacterium]